MNPDKKTARIAGLLYLLIAVFSGFGLSYRKSLVVPLDILATVQNIKDHEVLFQMALFSDLLGQIIQIFLVLVLYELFKAVNKKQALFMAILVLIAVPIAMLNQINQFAVLSLINSAEYLKAYTADQLYAQVTLFLNLHQYGFLIATIFWGLWLFPLGYLVIKSNYMPKVLGILLIVAGLGYLIDGSGHLLIPNYHLEIAIYTFVGEVIFLLWLLIKGIKVQSLKG